MTLKYSFVDDFEYDIDWVDIQYALKNILKKKSKEDLLDIILDLVNDYDVEEYFEEELTEYFEDDARENFNDSLLYEKDIYSYYGVSINDFI